MACEAIKSVFELDVDVGVVAAGGGTHDSTNAGSSAATTADDATEVAFADTHFQRRLTVTTGDGADTHRIRVVNDGLHDVQQHSGRCRDRADTSGIGRLAHRTHAEAFAATFLGGLAALAGLLAVYSP